MEKQNAYYEVRVYARGIKKRCRKVEFKGFPMANAILEVKDDLISQAAWIGSAKLRLKEEMKEIISIKQKPFISFMYCVEKERGVIEYHMFDERNFKLTLEDV